MDVPLPSQVPLIAWRAVRHQPSRNPLCYTSTFSTWVPEISPTAPATAPALIPLSFYLAVQLGVDDLLRLIRALYSPGHTPCLDPRSVRLLCGPAWYDDGIVASQAAWSLLGRHSLVVGGGPSPSRVVCIVRVVINEPIPPPPSQRVERERGLA